MRIPAVNHIENDYDYLSMLFTYNMFHKLTNTKNYLINNFLKVLKSSVNSNCIYS